MMLAEQEIIKQAIFIIEGNMRKKEGFVFTSPEVVSDYLKIKFSSLEYEAFSILYLDAQHRLIECREMFKGTFGSFSVYPRGLVEAALELNSSAVILVSNHPCGDANPSRADKVTAQKVKSVFELIDIKVLDFIVVGGLGHTSFSSSGLI